MHKFQWVHILKIERPHFVRYVLKLKPVPRQWGGGPEVWGVLTVRAFCRAEKSMINDHILSKNSFGKGHHCCSLFSPNKFYTISFLRLTPCLPPHSWSQSHRRLSSHHTPWTHAQSQSAGRENVCWPQPLHAAHHKYDFLWLGIQIFPFRALNNSILIISSFF